MKRHWGQRFMMVYEEPGLWLKFEWFFQDLAGLFENRSHFRVVFPRFGFDSGWLGGCFSRSGRRDWFWLRIRRLRDRKSTRLNSSHSQISYAVFCLKKK